MSENAVDLQTSLLFALGQKLTSLDLGQAFCDCPVEARSEVWNDDNGDSDDAADDESEADNVFSISVRPCVD